MRKNYDLPGSYANSLSKAVRTLDGWVARKTANEEMAKQEGCSLRRFLIRDLYTKAQDMEDGGDPESFEWETYEPKPYVWPDDSESEGGDDAMLCE